MDLKPQKILIIAGEESGDMRAASLVREIKAIHPDIRFFGIAGDHCRREGVETFADITELAVIGFFEVLRNIHRIKQIFDLTLQQAKKELPVLAILVDYPGFNLRIAEKLNKLGIKVVYYVSPQIWAWKESRVHLIKQVVDRMMVLFPFEKDLYARHDYKADFVGHPLIDEVRATIPRDIFLKDLGFDPDRPVIAILPGSRPKEISQLLKPLLLSACLIQKKRPDVQIILLKAKNLPLSLFTPYLSNPPKNLKISEDYYNALNACSIANVCSGTATLETALMKKPMVVIYKTSWITWFIGRMLVKIRHVSLVNIVSGKKIVEELLQNQASPKNIAGETLKLLDPSRARIMTGELEEIRNLLGVSGASRRAAKIVMEEFSHIDHPGKIGY